MWTLFVFFFSPLGQQDVAVEKLENIETQAQCLAIKRQLTHDIITHENKMVIYSCVQTKDRIKS